MKNKLLTTIVFLSGLLQLTAQDTLVIQENTVGICTMDGIIDNSVAGFTGEGYANISDGTGVGMSWSFEVPSPGIYSIRWRYALGGSDVTARDARLMIDNVYTNDTVRFPHSGSSSWAVWMNTDTSDIELPAGQHTVRLVSITHKGLPNIDYFLIGGTGIVPAQCLPSFTFNIGLNDSAAGTVSYSPVQEYYDSGTTITVSAQSNPGYFFHSWSGEAASASSNHNFIINTNTNLTALFYPEGTTMDENAIGYATVQHDNGTPYLLTGGSLGETVQAHSLADLQSYLGAAEPYVVELAEHITGLNTDEIAIVSNKSLIGTTDVAGIEGIRVSINAARNIIIRNLSFSKVIRFDEIEINGGSRNIWIDHCDFFTDLDHDIDYYDGLLDIKNQSSFITVSWSKFHDHQKCVLISSGDQETQDSVIRITLHHNYFYQCNSRLPSIRFGKAHIFNNLYVDAESGVNSRMGACVRVEKNYFMDAGTGVGMMFSPVPGAVEILDNVFINTGHAEEPSCVLDVPYEYTAFLDEPESLPQIIPAGTGGPGLPSSIGGSESEMELKIFPNPASESMYVKLPKEEIPVSIRIYNMMGQEQHVAFADAGLIMKADISKLTSGIYLLKIKTENSTICRKIIVE